MEKKTYRIYEIIPAPTEITRPKIEIATEVFDKLKSVGLNNQSDTILLEVTHDDLYSFVGFVVDQTINILIHKK